MNLKSLGAVLVGLATIIACLAAIASLIVQTNSPSPLPVVVVTSPSSSTFVPATFPPSDELPIYDSFDDNCIDANRWTKLLAWQAPTPEPSQTGRCLDLAAYGLEEHDGQLWFTCSNPATDLNRSYTLLAAVNHFTEVEMSVTVDSVYTGFGVNNLLFNLDDKWSYYGLWYGGEWPNTEGRVVFETEGRSGDAKVVPERKTSYPWHTVTRLRLEWANDKLHFFVNDREVLTEPTRTMGQILGISCSMGFNQGQGDYGLKASIDEVRIR